MNDSIKVCGLWLSVAPDGELILHGRYTPIADIVIRQNKNRKSDDEPGFFVFVEPNENPEEDLITRKNRAAMRNLRMLRNLPRPKKGGLRE